MIHMWSSGFLYSRLNISILYLPVTGISGKDDCRIIARKIQATEQPIEYDNIKCHIGNSIGISLYPVHGNDSELLVSKADQAMYKVKKSGKNDFSFY